MTKIRERKARNLCTIILTAVFMISALPAITWRAQAAETVVYTLNRDPGTGGEPLRDLKEYGDRNWAYAADTVSATTTPAQRLEASFQVKTAIGEWIAIKVRAPEVGVYDVKLDYQKSTYAGQMDIYMVPAPETINKESVEAAMEHAEPLVSSFEQRGAPGTFGSAELNGVAVASSDEYLVIFLATGKDPRSYASNVYPRTVTLTPNPSAQVSGISTKATTAGLEIGETLNTKTYVHYTNDASVHGMGSTVLLPNVTAQVEYESDANAVFSVDAGGMITAHAAGSAELTTTVVIGEQSYIHILPVTVMPPTADEVTAGEMILNAKGAQRTDITVDGIEYAELGSTSDVALGTQVMLTAAKENDTGKFLYWKDSLTDRIISTEQAYLLTIGTGTQITAVYQNSGEGYLVEFIDQNGKVLQTQYLDAGIEITAPKTPIAVGHQFKQWGNGFEKGITATRDAIFIAEYTKAVDERYTVITEDAILTTQPEETYQYNTKIILQPDMSSAPEGSKFAFWTKNGSIVSYENEYSFFVWDDTQVNAVFLEGGDKLSALPTVIIDKSKSKDGNAFFCAEWVAPEEYTVVESGILLSEGSILNLDSFKNKATALSKSNNGQFTAYVNVDEGAVLYVRTYLVYKDSDDNCRVIYSDIVEYGIK